MKSLPVRFLTVFFAGALAVSAQPESAASAQSTPPPLLARPADETPEKIQIEGVNLLHGPAIAKLGGVAELKVPAGYAFVGPDSLDKFFELTRNMRGGKEVGVLISPSDSEWLLFFDYEPAGYVKDDDKDKLQADKLYASLKEGEKYSNDERRKRGWPEIVFQGWERKPYYDEKTNNLKWALRLSSSSDGHKAQSINQDIRLLGRGGYVTATLVTSVDAFAADAPVADQVLAGFNYVEGQRYAEYKKGDKLAEYGLAALVVGGAGAIALKTGLFAYLAKFWKVVVAAIVALGAGIAKFFKKMSGRE